MDTNAFNFSLSNGSQMHDITNDEYLSSMDRNGRQLLYSSRTTLPTVDKNKSKRFF